MRACAVAAILAASCGCVSRELVIVSTPPGGVAYLNGVRVGVTPVSVPFRHYGDYTIEIEMEGRAAVRAVERIRSPWYCRFPLGLISEALLPVRIRDERHVSYELVELVLPDKDELLKAAARGAE